MTTDIRQYVLKIAEAAKAAYYTLATASTAQKNNALIHMAEL